MSGEDLARYLAAERAAIEAAYILHLQKANRNGHKPLDSDAFALWWIDTHADEFRTAYKADPSTGVFEPRRTLKKKSDDLLAKGAFSGQL